MDKNIVLEDLKNPADLKRLKDYLRELFIFADAIYTTTAPNGSISDRRGKFALYFDGTYYSTWINTDGATTWKQTNTIFGTPGSNYASFESDGTLVFYGNATVWEDLNFDPARSGGPVATRPDDVTINNCFYKEFTSANNQSCGDSQEVPHRFKLSQKLYGHLHCFLKAGESAGTTGVTFTIYWALRQESGLTTGSFTLSATSAQLTANPVKFDVFDNTGFNGPTTVGGQLALGLYRTGGNAGDVVVTTYGVHYEVDMVGSRQLATK